jgi:hypothetical protein
VQDMSPLLQTRKHILAQVARLKRRYNVGACFQEFLLQAWTTKKNQDFTNVLMHRIAKLTVGFVAE